MVYLQQASQLTDVVLEPKKRRRPHNFLTKDGRPLSPQEQICQEKIYS